MAPALLIKPQSLCRVNANSISNTYHLLAWYLDSSQRLRIIVLQDSQFFLLRDGSLLIFILHSNIRPTPRVSELQRLGMYLREMR